MIQTTKQIIDIINEGRLSLTSLMLKSLIEDHRAGDGRKQKLLWDRYKLENVPIKGRTPAAYEKVDRRTANDFFADIVDTKAGYMGNEVSVTLSKSHYTEGEVLKETQYEADTEWLRDWQIKANAEDMNSEMVAMAAACGIGYRLIYVPVGENTVWLKNLNPWEVIYIYDQSIDVPQVALRYYTIRDTEFGNKNIIKDLTAVEWYDAKGITYYIDDGELNFSIDESRGGYEPHLFEGVPIIPFPNNGLLMAEPGKVLDLIDAYDAIISSTTSEIEQLRLAYMFVKGAGTNIDQQFVKTLEQTGIFGLSEDGEVGFVNKQLFDTPIHNLLAEIRKNIYQFSKSIDMSRDFGGEMRVIGWQVALLNLENSCKITERKFIRALRKQYELMSQFWDDYGMPVIDPMSLEFTFTRNFPRDLHSEAETLSILLGSVSKQTAYAQMSFIDDPEKEIELMEGETSPFRGFEEDIDEPEPKPEQQDDEA